MDPSLPQQHFERAVASVLGGSTPATTGAQTHTTTTHTSTTVASLAVGGPANALYARIKPSVGLTSVCPARQAFLPPPVDPRGSTPRAWPGPSACRAELGILGNIWRDSFARGDLRPEFDRSQVANGFVLRAVEPGATGEPYPSHSLGMDPAPTWRLDAFPQNGYGKVMPHATVELSLIHISEPTRPY